jgi:hypothetical protein
MGLQKSHNDCNIQHYHFLRYGVGAELDAHPQLFSLLPTSPAYRRGWTAHILRWVCLGRNGEHVRKRLHSR